MKGAIICWHNPLNNRLDYEEFDSMELALAELEKWKVSYPWNTYTVAAITMVHESTQQWKHRLHHSVISQVGETADAAGEIKK